MQDFGNQLHELMTELESELQRLGLWSERRPPPQALQSTLPFGVDTLSFPEWLQWVCLPQFRDLLVRGAPFPAACAIAPMAEVTYRDSPLDTTRLITVLTAIDRVVTTHPGRPR